MRDNTQFAILISATTKVACLFISAGLLLSGVFISIYEQVSGPFTVSIINSKGGFDISTNIIAGFLVAAGLIFGMATIKKPILVKVKKATQGTETVTFFYCDSDNLAGDIEKTLNEVADALRKGGLNKQ